MTRKSTLTTMLGDPSAPFGPPEIVDVEPIHTCNFRCVQCHVSAEVLSHQAIDVDAFRRSIESLDLRGKWACVGATHEPCMHPKFDEIVQILTEAGMHIDLTTNGSLFTDKLIDKIKDGSFAKVTISFDGAMPETYEKVRRNADWSRTLSRVKNFKAAVGNDNTYWAVNYTVMRSTVGEITAAARLWEGMGFDMVGYISMVLRNGLQEAVAEAMDDALVDRMKVELAEAAHIVRSEGYRISVASAAYDDGRPVLSDNPEAFDFTNCRPLFNNGYHPDVPVACRAPYKSLRIGHDNGVRLCFDKSHVGDIRNETLADIWYGEAARRWREAIKSSAAICHDCEYYKFCIKAGQVDSTDPSNRVSNK